MMALSHEVPYTFGMPQTLRCPYFQKAFGWCVPIGALAGLIGLGGGEFRLPVLMYAIGFSAKSAVPVNLIVSLVTLAFAMTVRSGIVPTSAILPHMPEILALAAGGIVSASYGAHLIHGFTKTRLVRIIAALLAAIGILMLTEVAFPFGYAALLPNSIALHVGAGFALGIGIGLVSSLLGVAGGELLIPTLVFIFGADIKTAGSASILISLFVVLTGVWRYARLGAIPNGRGVQRIATAMAAGSIMGAAIGALAAAYAPVAFLKALLGCVLLAAAAKIVLSRGQ